MIVGTFLLVVASALLLVGWVLTLVAAFRVSTTWGLLSLFVPLAAFVFLFRYWPETRVPALLHLAGLGALVVGMAVVVGAGAITAGRQAESSYRSEGAQPSSSDQGSGWPPVSSQLESLPTPVPLPEIPIGYPEPTPLPTPTRPLALSQIGPYLDRLVELVEKDGTTSRVFVREVTPTHVKVAEPYGGGGITYSIPREKIQGFRPVRRPG